MVAAATTEPSPMSFGELIGARVLEDDPEHVVCELTIGTDHLNQALIAQGGVVFALADVALGLLMNRDGEDATWVTTAFNLQLFRGLGVGDTARASARVEHRSRSLCAARVSIYRADGALVGSLTNQAVRLPRRAAEPVDADRLVVRRLDERTPLGSAMAAARRRLHGAPSPDGEGSPVVVEFDGAPIGCAVIDESTAATHAVQRVWAPAHQRGTPTATAMQAALESAASRAEPDGPGTAQPDDEDRSENADGG